MSKKAGLLVIAVTGTPAAGKSTFAARLSKEIGARIIEANDLVEKNHLFSGVDENGSKIVTMEALAKSIRAEIKASTTSGEKAIILSGHLLSDLKIEYDIAIVIRVALTELIKRMEARGYSGEKLKENIASESIDYCGAQISELSKETYEVETDADKAMVILYVKEKLSGKNPKPPELKPIDKLQEMLELVYEGNSYGL